MKRRLLAGGMAVVALLAAALVLRPDAEADAAPGAIDLEVTVTGTYSEGVTEDTGSLQVDVTNTDDDVVEVSAQDVVVDLNLVTDGLTSMDPHVASDGTYDAGSFEWTIPVLDPGEIATLTLYPHFIQGAGEATVSAEVVSVEDGQVDVDSSPAENVTIGDEDDEAVYRIQPATGLDPFTGYVWNDVDDDGRFDAGEPFVPDTFVRISDDASGDVVYWARTDELGTYSYDHLPNSTVDVQFTAPDGWDFTTQNAIDPDGSDPDATGLVADRVVDGSNRSTVDAGLVGDADLLLTKTTDEASGVAPFTPTYTIQVRNDGPSATSAVEVEDRLSAAAGSVTIVHESHGAATYDDPSDTITWDLGGGLLLAGETATLSYTATYSGFGTFPNEAQVLASSEPDPDSAPNAPGTACALQAPDDDCAAASVQVVPEAEPQDDQLLVPQGVALDFNPLQNDGIFGWDGTSALPPGWVLNRTGSTTQGSITCSAVDGDCTYTPVEDFSGGDSFTYELVTPTAAEYEQTVTIEVLQVNDAPTAVDDRAVTAIDTAVEVDVLANDVDPNAPTDQLTITSAGTLDPPGAGSWSCAGATGPCTFDPASDFEGEATVTYEIADEGDSDDRVDDPGVPGGIVDDDPLTDEAEVTLLVDPDLLPTDTGFTGGTGDVAEAQTAAWQVSTTASATAGCAAGRPEVEVSWTPVDRAEDYLVERQVVGSGLWIRLGTTGSTSTTDVLVGEDVDYAYRVTPLVGTWTGVASLGASDTTPPIAGPEGC